MFQNYLDDHDSLRHAIFFVIASYFVLTPLVWISQLKQAASHWRSHDLPALRKSIATFFCSAGAYFLLLHNIVKL